VLISLLLTCFVALVLATALLLALGHRARFASRIVGVLLGAGLAVGAGEVAARVWTLEPRAALAGEALLVALTIAIVGIRPQWNPVGQAFFAAFAAASLGYLAFAGAVTFAGGLPPLAVAASAALLVLEVAALTLSGSFTFECLDSVSRARWPRPAPASDPAYLPKVSIQVPAYNEPPDMLIETIQSLEKLDYPDYEVVVIDNNTTDPDTWQPVARWCEGRERIKFVHVEGLEGFKSGALNLALREHVDPAAELIAVVDADYLVDPAWLRDVAPYFADPSIAFVQTPQDYREFEGDAYLTACYDAFRYFFATTMPARNQRDSIIFAGTMGVLRRAAIDQIGEWDTWTITEDAEASLRMLRRGWSGLYVPKSYGRGVMPLTFSALKSQRFRWCFGGMQILRRHWRSLLPWDRSPDNRLTLGQRLDYLLGGVQWLNDLVYLAFSVVLLVTAGMLAVTGHSGLRPLVGLAVLLPAALVGSGLLRALWALRHSTGIGPRRAVLAFLNWLSLSWAVALGCVQGLVRSKGVFLRTPKTGEDGRALDALVATRSETALAVALWGVAVAVAAVGVAGPLLLGLLAWQGVLYASSPFMAWLNLHTKLSAQLERRRRTELLRERVAKAAPYAVGGAVGAAATALLVALFVAGGSQPAPDRPSQFTLPPRAEGGGGSPLRVVPGGGRTTTPSAPGSTASPESTAGGTSTTEGPTSSEPAPTTAGPETTVPTTAPPSTTAP
jgi:cellulose synthase/poly-beta-1,6-N-acetylglucosamine synthase-like glycosyltransferase